jgi:hypothetical protein
MAPVNAGTASQSFLVKATVKQPSRGPCRGTGEPLSVECGGPGGVTVLQPSSSQTLMGNLDAWLVPASGATTYGGVYAASLSTRVVHVEGWEYVETTISW